VLRDAGDIIDRLSIAQLKTERIGSPENKNEFRECWEGLFTHILIHPDINWWQLIEEIYGYNRRIWELESEIRCSKIDNNVLEVGRRAIEIRDYNKQRVRVKNHINKLFGEGFPEIKKDHISE